MNMATRLDAPPVPAEAARLYPTPSVVPSGTLRCEFFAPGALPTELAAQWAPLADHAAEPNAFAERWFLEPSLAHLADRGDVRIAALVSQEGLLGGLMPLVVKTHYGRVPLRNVQNWKHDNAFLGTPLIRRGMECAFWTALLDALDQSGWATGLLHVAGLDRRGPVLAGLEEAAAAAGRPCDIVHRTHRALLRSEKSPDAYWVDAVRKKKRKEIARLANRLVEQGRVEYATLSSDGDVARWADEFLDLEAKGWKGRTGSALACSRRTQRFFRDSMAGAHAAGKLDFHRIDLDGKPIAMLVNFLSPPGGFSFKIAFDEDYARYSPGVLIERYNLRILDRPDIAWMDSCASQNHPMIDSLWSERRDIVRVTLPLGGSRHRAIFHACRSAERLAAFLKGRKG